MNQSSGTLSPLKRFAGVCGLLVVIIVSTGVGYVLSRPDPNAPPPPTGVIPTIVFFLFGLFLLVLGTISYGFILVTHCLTFNFSRPFFGAYKPKLWIANLVTTILVQAGFAFMVGAQVEPLMKTFLPPAVASPAAFFIPFIAAQFVLVWFQIWAPLENSITHRRLKSVGISDTQRAAGVLIGISDPTKNSLKRLTLVEDDLGMLWIDADRLIYRGDTRSFDIAPHELHRVERKADAGSTSSYFGAVHVILHVRPPDAPAYAVRLHPQGQWTMTAKAAQLRTLADRLESWHAAAATPVAAA
jgi:hypothetical protein